MVGEGTKPASPVTRDGTLIRDYARDYTGVSTLAEMDEEDEEQEQVQQEEDDEVWGIQYILGYSTLLMSIELGIPSVRCNLFKRRKKMSIPR